MIVVDASAALLGLLGNGDARRILQSEVLHVPALADSEVASALRKSERNGSVKTEDALRALGVWGCLGIHRHLAVGLLDRIWDLRQNFTAYDATYVALAEALGCDLLTANYSLTRSPGIPCPVRVVTS